MHYSESSVPFNTPPEPLHRSHSLECEHKHTSDSLEGGMDLDIHAAAKMIESFDVDEFLNGVVTPVATTSTPNQEHLLHSDSQVLTAGSDGMLVLTETTANGFLSEASDDSASELTASARVADTVVSGDGSEENKKLLRKSRKDEIVDLRESVEELTDQLEALKADPPQEAPVACQSDIPLVKRSGPSLWKHIAMRQLDKRRKAEEDNVMLRDMLEMQVQEAKCLQRILKRRTKIQLMEDLLGMKRRKKTRVSSVPSDSSQIFSKMLRDTDEIYAQVDSHFAEEGVNDLPCPGQKRKINRSTMNGVVFEMALRNLLPFSFQKTEKVAQVVLTELGTSGLKRIKDIDKMIDFHAQETEESRDTLATSYFSAKPGNNEASGAQVRKVMRIYNEENRAVFIWKMLAEPKLKGSNASMGYQLQSTLQVVMRPGETPTLSGDESTQILIHFSASRHDLGFPVNAKYREPGHMDSGVALWEKLITRIPQEIESDLIDDICGATTIEVPSCATQCQADEGNNV